MGHVCIMCACMGNTGIKEVLLLNHHAVWHNVFVLLSTEVWPFEFLRFVLIVVSHGHKLR